jgi:hypothetical protein
MTRRRDRRYNIGQCLSSIPHLNFSGSCVDIGLDEWDHEKDEVFGDGGDEREDFPLRVSQKDQGLGIDWGLVGGITIHLGVGGVGGDRGDDGGDDRGNRNSNSDDGWLISLTSASDWRKRTLRSKVVETRNISVGSHLKKNNQKLYANNEFGLTVLTCLNPEKGRWQANQRLKEYNEIGSKRAKYSTVYLST